MRIDSGLVLLACGMSLVCLSGWASDRWNIRDEETVNQTLLLAGVPMRLMVDNVNGYVHVKGTDGAQVRVTAHKTIRAETDSDLQKAKNEVKLKMTQEPGTVSIYYDAPWRCRGDHQDCSGRDTGRRFYEVTYDIDVEAPRNARPVISTVNGGNVRIEQTAGNFDISNVNGAITMTGVSGSGDVHTVNGPVTVSFARNPTEASSFKSVNGPIEVYFQPPLSADLSFKTMNGGIYANFDVIVKAAANATAEQRGGRFVYRSNGEKHATAGQGGAALSFNTVNGDIRLHQSEQGPKSNE
jgi:hypothetical protein